MTKSQGARRRAYDGFDGEIGRTFSESTPSWPAETSASTRGTEWATLSKLLSVICKSYLYSQDLQNNLKTNQE